MTRWLLLSACVALVAGSVAYRVISRGDDAPAEKVPAASCARSAMAEGSGPSGPGATSGGASPAARAATPQPPAPETKAMRERLLKDDTLAPPPAEVPETTKRAYEHAVNAIATGNDPLKAQTPSSTDTNQEEMLRRIQERQKAAQERMKEIRAEHKKAMEARAKKRADDRAARAATRDPNRPMPQPLFERPKLGPPVNLTDDPTPDGAPSSPPSTQ